MKKILFCGFFFIAISLKAQEFQTKKIDSLFFLLDKHDKVMGSLSIYHKGKSVYQTSIGYTDVDKKIENSGHTKYRIGSVSKLFTATILMQLIEEGKLSLETKLSQFYPGLPNADQITIQHLQQHKSGIFDIIRSPNFEEWMLEKRSKDELLSKIKEIGVTFSPGEKRSYSNTNYILLTFIIEDIESQDFADILKKRILKPLKLKNTYYGKKTYPENFGASSYKKENGDWKKIPGIHMSIPKGAGGIVSTPEDLNKFIYSLMEGKLVSENSLATIANRETEEGEDIVGHAGGMDGFKSFLIYHPEKNMSLALSLNGVDYRSMDIVRGILKVMLNKKYDLPQLEPVK
ncbi:serine hydrolase [Pontibacter sp. SGAir0037]|uniref:serine hydrolase domain-containing protein n=1 Tax=Pontibacter sp. SGAir0037 TaxID=2571030 RepID=UPI0010CD5213|nr:serine hydrolase domain-containing protein [Pontibacter sp. SGAir0037]QCR22760.1 peptidase [Pontibacter sp. SGAir0037]